MNNTIPIPGDLGRNDDGCHFVPIVAVLAVIVVNQVFRRLVQKEHREPQLHLEGHMQQKQFALGPSQTGRALCHAAPKALLNSSPSPVTTNGQVDRPRREKSGVADRIHKVFGCTGCLGSTPPPPEPHRAPAVCAPLPTQLANEQAEVLVERLEMIPGFDVGVHVRGPRRRPPAEWPEALRRNVQRLRAEFTGDPQFARHERFGSLSDGDLACFVMARQGRIDKAADMLRAALRWRSRRMPYWLLSDPESDVSKAFEAESRTGKLYIRGRDRCGRSILCMDCSVENTKDGGSQMRFVAYQLEAARALCAPGVDKICTIFNLEDFSFLQQPPFSVVKEFAEIMQVVFPETLGTAVLWQPPKAFLAFFSLVQHLLDAKTRAKMVMVRGEASPGSENDTLLSEMFGNDWRTATGLGLKRHLQPATEPSGPQVFGARGYEHSEYWPTVKCRDRQRAQALGGFGPPWARTRADVIDAQLWDGAYPQYWAANLAPPTD